MSILKHAVEALETSYLNHFMCASFDNAIRVEILLDIHKYFKYQSKIYNFSVKGDVHELYKELRTGHLNGARISSPVQAFYIIDALTLVSHSLMVELSNTYEGYEDIDSLIELLSHTLGDMLCMHGNKQELIDDPYYQKTLSASEWSEVLIDNPWFIVAVLFKYTGYNFVNQLYGHYEDIKPLLGSGGN